MLPFNIELLPILIQSPKSLSSLLEPYSMEKWLGYSGLCKTFAEHVLCMYVKNDIGKAKIKYSCAYTNSNK